MNDKNDNCNKNVLLKTNAKRVTTEPKKLDQNANLNKNEMMEDEIGNEIQTIKSTDNEILEKIALLVKTHTKQIF